jgi:HSP20 family protein
MRNAYVTTAAGATDLICINTVRIARGEHEHMSHRIRINPFDLPARPALRIKIDLHELAHAFVLRADVPGVHRRGIHVNIRDDVVSLRAELAPRLGRRGEQIVVRERGYGTAKRSVSLPAVIDARAARTRYRDGVLTLTLPKRAPRPARKLVL